MAGPPFWVDATCRKAAPGFGPTASGRLGLVTNVRNPAKMDPQAPSRGHLVTQWLQGDTDYEPPVASPGHERPQRLQHDCASTLPEGECFWLNNERLYPERLHKGVFGLSNAELNTPWPKVVALKAQLRWPRPRRWMPMTWPTASLPPCQTPPWRPMRTCPDTGVPAEWEKMLVFGVHQGARVALRHPASTAIITERVNKRLVTHVMERSFSWPVVGGADAPCDLEELATPSHHGQCRGGAPQCQPAAAVGPLGRQL